MYLGVKAVFAKSIERIHAANLVNFGIVPFSFDEESDYDSLPENAEIRIPGIRNALMKGDDSVTAFYNNWTIELEDEPLRTPERHSPGRWIAALYCTEKKRKIDLPLGQNPF